MFPHSGPYGYGFAPPPFPSSQPPFPSFPSSSQPPFPPSSSYAQPPFPTYNHPPFASSPASPYPLQPYTAPYATQPQMRQPTVSSVRYVGSSSETFTPRFPASSPSAYSGLYAASLPAATYADGTYKAGTIKGAVDGSPGIFPYTYGDHTVLVERRDTEGATVAGVVWNAAQILSQFMVEALPEDYFAGKRVLELGSGTGLTGILAAKLGGEVVLTDLPLAVPLLEDQIALNDMGENVSAAVLSWGEEGDAELDALGAFDLVIGTDVTYTALPKLKHTLLRLTEGENPPQILLGHERRWKSTDEYFESLMAPSFDYDLVHKTQMPESGEIIVFTLTRKRVA